MPDPAAPDRPRIEPLAKVISAVAAVPFVAAIAFAWANRPNGVWLENWLTGAFLLSIGLLFIGAVLLSFWLERRYRQAASGRGGPVILGGGFVLMLLLLIPVVKLAAPQLQSLHYTGAPGQTAVCLLLWAAFWVWNGLRLRAAGPTTAASTVVSLCLLLPVTGLAALWLVALGKAMLIFGETSNLAGWLIGVLETVNGIYALGLAAAACNLTRLYSGFTPARAARPRAGA